MHDELDPDLARAFAQVREPLADEEFSASLLRKLERARRARVRRQVLLVAAAVIVVSLNLHWVLDQCAAAVRAAGELTPPLSADLLTTPWGWAASLGLGAGLLLHFRPSRRR
ncbi:MAG: hypothetical protein WA803_15545 [Steroidobacteraceae bacterium]